MELKGGYRGRWVGCFWDALGWTRFFAIFLRIIALFNLVNLLSLG
jgi:hypothetical protein